MSRAPFTFLLVGIAALPGRAEPQSIASVTLNPSSVIGGATVTVIVTLSENAGPAGITIKLESSKTAIATVSQSYVVVQPGTRTANFLVQTKPVAGNPNVVADPPFVDLTAGGSVSGGPNVPPTPIVAKNARLVVLPPSLASLTVHPSSVPGGTAATAEVRLTGPAPASGLTITLTSKLTGPGAGGRTVTPGVKQGVVISVPAQVTIPAGATSATFQVTTRRVTAATPAQVTASYGAFGPKNATLTITP